MKLFVTFLKSIDWHFRYYCLCLLLAFLSLHWHWHLAFTVLRIISVQKEPKYITKYLYSFLWRWVCHWNGLDLLIHLCYLLYDAVFQEPVLPLFCARLCSDGFSKQCYIFHIRRFSVLVVTLCQKMIAKEKMVAHEKALLPWRLYTSFLSLLLLGPSLAKYGVCKSPFFLWARDVPWIISVFSICHVKD